MKLPQMGEFVTMVEQTGKIVAKDFGQVHFVLDKEDGTPVTRTDIKVNDKFKTYAESYNLGFIGEEGNGAENTDHHIVVDPLDGTAAFVRGMATVTVIASILYKGQPIMAVIHNPITKQTWSARVGHGAWYKYRHALFSRISTAKSPSRRWRTAICAWPGVDQPFADFQKKVLESPDFSDQQMGAFGLGGGLIASGLLHATAISATSAVETAAMSLIVREAGGIAIDLLGRPLSSFELGQHKGKAGFLLPQGAIIACNKEVAEALAELY